MGKAQRTRPGRDATVLRDGAEPCYFAAGMSRALQLYRGLRGDADGHELAKLKREVRAHFEGLVEAQRQNELIALDLAEALCRGLTALIDQADRLDASQRAMVVGAAKYFISDDDARPDAASCTGLDDDVEVFNHVASELGRPDLLISDG